MLVSLFLLLDPIPMEDRESKGSPLLLRWRSLAPSSPFSRSSSSIYLSFSLVVVAELRMDHYVISRQAFNCFRDGRASERGWHSWHVRPRPPRSPTQALSAIQVEIDYLLSKSTWLGNGVGYATLLVLLRHSLVQLSQHSLFNLTKTHPGPTL